MTKFDKKLIKYLMILKFVNKNQNITIKLESL